MTVPIQRRGFLGRCLALLGCGVLPLSAAVIPRPVRTVGNLKPTLAMLTKENFEDCLGNEFQMETAPGVVSSLTLAEVKGYPKETMRSGANREPFALLFRGPKELNVPQKMFKLCHPTLGAHEIFLVPLGPDEQGSRLEAVFS